MQKYNFKKSSKSRISLSKDRKGGKTSGWRLETASGHKIRSKARAFERAGRATHRGRSVVVVVVVGLRPPSPPLHHGRAYVTRARAPARVFTRECPATSRKCHLRSPTELFIFPEKRRGGAPRCTGVRRIFSRRGAWLKFFVLHLFLY